MPNHNRNKNKRGFYTPHHGESDFAYNKNYSKNKSGGIHKHHNRNGGGGGGGGGGGHRINGGPIIRKSFFNPNVIKALEDETEDLNINQNSSTSTETHHGNYNNRDGHKNKKKNDRNKVFEKLKNMGGKQKLAIGETEEDEKKSLLPSTPHCKLNNMPDDVFQMVVGYVQKYFTCYDGDRQGLLGAYNQKCIFSLCLNMSNAVAHRSFKFEDILIKDNRNLKRIVGGEDYHFDKRAKLLHIGYIDTVNFLCKLPATEHEPSSFKLDNCFFSNNLITFSLSGVFKEGKSTDKVRPLRSFHRVFTCIPDPNSQMTIVNEQFIISNVSKEQFNMFFSERAPAQSANTIQNQPESTTLSTNIPTQAIPTELVGLSEQQILMAKEFSAKSRLNLEWSKHCLDHSKWIFDDAANAFMQFKESIPKEAYLA